MNDTTAIPAEVRLFLAVVRRELADLDPDELSEITDGLEADLADLVAERGAGALGDPKLYARELRSAAGITETPARKKVRGSLKEAVTGFLDECHGWFDRQVERVPGDVAPALEWLRPAWWILRAICAALLAGAVFGSLQLALVIAIPFALVSIQIGRGKIWPGGRRGLGSRLLLIGLNAFAAVALLPVLSSEVNIGGYSTNEWDQGWQDGYNQALAESGGGDPGYMGGDAAGTWLSLKGKAVTNIYAYDSQGRRVAGVQLFDQDGRPLEVAAQGICPKTEVEGGEIGKEEDGNGGWVCHDYDRGQNVPGYVLYPWTNGQAQLKNVFPLAGRMQESLEPSATAFSEAMPPDLGEWPFAEVPRVSLPGITSGPLPPAEEKTEAPAAEETPTS